MVALPLAFALPLARPDCADGALRPLRSCAFAFSLSFCFCLAHLCILNIASSTTLIIFNSPPPPLFSKWTQLMDLHHHMF